jgi:hypothetical protein
MDHMKTFFLFMPGVIHGKRLENLRNAVSEAEDLLKNHSKQFERNQVW